MASLARQDTTIRGHALRGTGILRNELYIGRLVWNRLTYIRNPATGRRVSRVNPGEITAMVNLGRDEGDRAHSRHSATDPALFQSSMKVVAGARSHLDLLLTG